MENEMELKLQEPQLEGLLTPLAGFQTFLCLYGADAETVCRKGWAAHRAPVIRNPRVDHGKRPEERGGPMHCANVHQTCSETLRSSLRSCHPPSWAQKLETGATPRHHSSVFTESRIVIYKNRDTELIHF